MDRHLIQQRTDSIGLSGWVQIPRKGARNKGRRGLAPAPPGRVQAKFLATNSQFTRFQKFSTYFGRALRVSM